MEKPIQHACGHSTTRKIDMRRADRQLKINRLQRMDCPKCRQIKDDQDELKVKEVLSKLDADQLRLFIIRNINNEITEVLVNTPFERLFDDPPYEY